MRTGPVTAARMLTVSEVTTDDGFVLVLPDPVFILPGDRYWTDGDLYIERVDGTVERYAGGWESRS